MRSQPSRSLCAPPRSVTLPLIDSNTHPSATDAPASTSTLSSAMRPRRTSNVICSNADTISRDTQRSGTVNSKQQQQQRASVITTERDSRGENHAALTRTSQRCITPNTAATGATAKSSPKSKRLSTATNPSSSPTLRASITNELESHPRCSSTEGANTQDASIFVDSIYVSRVELTELVGQLQQRLRDRTDSVNAIQRNFDRLSASYRNDQVELIRVRAELQKCLRARNVQLLQTKQHEQHEQEEDEETERSARKVMRAMQSELTLLIAERQTLSRRCDEAEAALQQHRDQQSFADKLEQHSCDWVHRLLRTAEIRDDAWQSKLELMWDVWRRMWCAVHEEQAKEKNEQRCATQAECYGELQRVHALVKQYARSPLLPLCERALSAECERVVPVDELRMLTLENSVEPTDAHSARPQVRTAVIVPTRAEVLTGESSLSTYVTTLLRDVQLLLRQREDRWIEQHRSAVTRLQEEQIDVLCAAERHERVGIQETEMPVWELICHAHHMYRKKQIEVLGELELQQRQVRQHVQEVLEQEIGLMQQKLDEHMQSKEDEMQKQMQRQDRIMQQQMEQNTEEQRMQQEQQCNQQVRELQRQLQHAHAETAAAQAATRMQKRTHHNTLAEYQQCVLALQHRVAESTLAAQTDKHEHAAQVAAQESVCHAQTRALSECHEHVRQLREALGEKETHMKHIQAEYDERFRAEQSAWASQCQWSTHVRAEAQLAWDECAQRALLVQDMWECRESLCYAMYREELAKEETDNIYKKVMKVVQAETVARMRLSDDALADWVTWLHAEMMQAMRATAHAQTQVATEEAKSFRAVREQERLNAAIATAEEKLLCTEEELVKAREILADQQRANTAMRDTEERVLRERRRCHDKEAAAAAAAATVIAATRALIAAEESSESLFSCPLCLQLFCWPVTCVPCGHTFCTRCLHQHPRNRDAKAPSRSVASAARCVLYCPECQLYNIREQVHSLELEQLAGKFTFRRNTLCDLLASMLHTHNVEGGKDDNRNDDLSDA